MNKFLSAGLINGRNIWKNNLFKSIESIKKIKKKINNDKLIITSSCSLLHSPVDLNKEQKIDSRINDWLSFADQKLDEIVFLQKFFNSNLLNKSEYLINNKISVKKKRTIKTYS